MNLRLSSHQVRLRLSPQEVTHLEVHSSLNEKVAAGPLGFGICLVDSAARLDLEAFQVSLFVPRDEFLTWLQSHEVEFEFLQDHNLKVLIEKDLKA